MGKHLTLGNTYHCWQCAYYASDICSRGTDITSEMCSGAHISRGNIYHCNTGSLLLYPCLNTILSHFLYNVLYNCYTGYTVILAIRIAIFVSFGVCTKFHILIAASN